MIYQGSLRNSVRLLKTSWQTWSDASINRKIVSGSLAFSFLTLGVKILGALKEAISAAYFGLGDDLDAFNVAFTIASFVIFVIGGAFQTAILPVYLETKKEVSREAVQLFLSLTITVCLLILIITTSVLWVTLPYLLPLIVSGFSKEKLELTRWLLYELFPLIALGGVSLTLSSILNAEEGFKITALTPGLTSISLIVAIFLLAGKLRVHALSIGLIVGVVVELIFLMAALRRRNLKLSFKVGWQNNRTKQVIINALPIVVAIALSGLMPIVDQSYAAKLNSGDIAALGFGNRIISLVLTLFATAVVTIVFPHFSKLAIEKDWEKLRQVFYTNIYKFILPVTVLSGLLIIIFSELFTRLFFQRGAFTPQDTKLVASIQMIYALQIPGNVIFLVGFRLLSAIQANKIIIIGALINLINTIWLNYYLSNAFGVKGIALTTSIVYVLAMIFTLTSISLEMKKRARSS